MRWKSEEVVLEMDQAGLCKNACAAGNLSYVRPRQHVLVEQDKEVLGARYVLFYLS